MTPASVAMLVTNRGTDDPRVCMEADGLAAAGLNVTVIGWDRDERTDRLERRGGVEFRRLAVRSTHGRGMTQPFFLGQFWLRAWEVLRAKRAKVVHCHDLDTLPLGCVAGRAMGANVVFDAHENYPDMMVGHLPEAAVAALEWLERKLAPRCDLLITVGRRLAEHYRKLGGREVAVVGNWKEPADFDLSASQREQLRRELGVPPGATAIGFVANLGRERHVEPLLRAVAGDERYWCVIGGDGPGAASAKSFAAEHRNVVYLGRVAPPKVPAITAACDLVYYGFDRSNPNARWSAPNKLYEALAAGRPMIAGDFGEVGLTIRQTGCGVLADTADPRAIRAALDEAGRKRAELIEASRNARGLFSRSRAMIELVGAYERMLRRRERRVAKAQTG